MSIAKAPLRGVSLKQASTIIDVALGQARKRDLRPMAIAVLDNAGDLVAYKREDHNGINRYAIAYAKAYGALVLNRSSREIGEMAETAPALIQSIASATGGQMIPVPGGVLIKDSQGYIIGCVGSSGAHPDDDEAIAILAIEALGLTPEPENITNAKKG